jgi:hypothetical protein
VKIIIPKTNMKTIGNKRENNENILNPYIITPPQYYYNTYYSISK